MIDPEFRVTELPLFRDERGCLSFAQISDHVPFPIKRVFWIFAAQNGTVRGQHAHRTQHQFLVAVSGTVTIELSNRKGSATFSLSGGNQGIYIPPLTWTTLRKFSPGVTIITFASDIYDAADYIHDYAELQRLSGASESDG